MKIRSKICGLKTVESIQAAQDNGAEFLGFVFCEKSPRNLSPEEVGELASACTAKKVAVVVDASDELLDAIVENLKPDFIQLHGPETQERASEIKKEYGVGLIRAVEPNEYPENLDIYDYLLIDPSHGQGKVFDWNTLQAPEGIEWFLSGGLNVDNVTEAVNISGALLVDVSSGVEAERGVKSPEKIKEFLDKVAEI